MATKKPVKKNSNQKTHHKKTHCEEINRKEGNTQTADFTEGEGNNSQTRSQPTAER